MTFPPKTIIMVLQFEREVEVMEKMYWFSTKNHAHDLEFRFARLQSQQPDD